MSPLLFRWNDWNLEHATKHGCTVEEIEAVIRLPGRGYPRKVGNDKWMAIGRGTGNRVIRVFFLRDPHPVIYVISAMSLTTRRRRG